MSGQVSARLLGAPQLLINGEEPPAELLWRKHLALCIALWCAPERRRSRDQLVGLLWSDKSERAAKHSLNEALRVIRRSVGSDAIDTTGDAVVWIDAPELDTDRFLALELGEPDRAAELVQGSFCDGLVVQGAQAFESWLTAERDRWQAKCVDALVRASAAAEDRGDARRALELAERAVSLNELSDLAAQSLIRAHWLAHDRAAALAAGDAFRRRLERDLGIEPEERTSALLARVERQRWPTP
ncbi:MAG: BTAD domain-containing putative transcriptional regulator, partial [Gemmatimonadota bacterium]